MQGVGTGEIVTGYKVGPEDLKSFVRNGIEKIEEMSKRRTNPKTQV